MRVSDVRKKYPEFFVEVEASVWDDTDCRDTKPRQYITDQARRRIAYNAAAVATLELHKIMMKIKKAK